MVHTETADTPSDLTRAGTVIGTPPYMPPEQAQSDWQLVDERADVFALGSILCEMLTGKPAYCGADTNEVFRRAKRGDVAEALRRLENCGADDMLMRLCLECLSYEREGRPRDAGVVAERVTAYQTEVQERLRRAELEKMAAEARAREEQTRLEAEEERTREALARLAAERRTRRRMLALSAAVLVTIATAFVLVRLSANQANEAKNRALELAEKNENLANAKSDLAEKEKNARTDAEKSQRTAETEARKAQAVAKFLGGIFEASDPMGLTSQSIIFPHASGEKLSGQDLLERGAIKCARELKNEPELQETVLAAIGNAFVNLGEYEKGKPLLEKALRLAEQRTDNSRDIATIQHALGSLYHAKGEYDKAEKLYQSALTLREQAQPINELLVADTLFNMGWLLTEKEDHAEAEKCYQRCLALRTKNLGNNDRLVALCQVGLAAVYLDRNDNYPQAWSLISQSIQTFQQLEGGQSLSGAMGLFQQGILLIHGSARSSLMTTLLPDSRGIGVRKLQECLQSVKASPLGKEHIYVAFVSGTLALELGRTGEDARAKPYFEECLKIVEDRVGLWHPKLDKVALGYAALLNRQQKKQEADHFFRSVLKAREDRFGKNHPQVANALVGYALIRGTRDPEGEMMMLRARGIYEQTQPLRGITSIQKYEACLNHLGFMALEIHHKPVEAERILRTAWNKFRDDTSIHPVDLATLRNNLAFILIELKHYEEAEPLLKEARAICEKEGQNGQITLKLNLNICYQMYLRQGRTDQVAAISRERRKLWPNDPDQLYLCGRNLMECVPLVGQGKTQLTLADQKLRIDYGKEGIADYQNAVALYRKSGGSKHPWYKFCLSLLGRALCDSQHFQEAEDFVEESLGLCRKDLGNRNPEVAYQLNLRARIRMAQQKYDGVEQNLREAENILSAVPVDQVRILGAPIQNERRVTVELFYQLFTATNQPVAELVRLFEEIVRQRKSKLGADDADTLSAQIRLANAYRAAGRNADTVRLLEQTLQRMEAKPSPSHPEMLLARNNLGAAYWSVGRMADAARLHEQTLKQRKDQLGPNHPDTLLSMANLGVTYRDVGRAKEGIALLEQVMQRGRQPSGGFLLQLAWVPGALAETYERAGQPAKAEAIHRDFLEQARRQFGSNDPRSAAQMAVLAHCVLRQHKYTAAELLLRDCLKVREAKLPDDWATFNARSMLGETLLGQKKYLEAEPLLREGYEGMRAREQQIPRPFDTLRLTEALERLIRLSEATNNKEKAGAWRKELADFKQPNKRHAALARRYAESVATDPKRGDDIERQQRYQAACSAVLAAEPSKDGRPLPDKVVVMFRRWALGWLHDDLMVYVQLAERNDPAVHQKIQQRLRHWRGDSALVTVRDPVALNRLPDNERIAWQALWREVDELTKRVAMQYETETAQKKLQP